MKGWTEKHLQDLCKAGRIQGYKVENASTPVQQTAKASKYNNKRVEYNGIWFDSIRECNRYQQLLLLQKAGEIVGEIRLQVPYELNEGGSHSRKYIADFVYTLRDGTEVVEDCKGFRTTVYKKNRRLMKQIYGIIIHET